MRYDAESGFRIAQQQLGYQRNKGRQHVILRTITMAALAAFALNAAADGKPDGKAVFDRACASCHSGGVPRAPSPETL